MFRTVPLLLLCLFVKLAAAQVTTNLNNTKIIGKNGWYARAYKELPDVELAPMDIREITAKENARNAQTPGDKPFRLAEPRAMDIDLPSSISWITDRSFAYGKYTITAKGALSLSINFDKFNLPEGSEMYVYNRNGNMITGPVTENENNPRRRWGSWVYKGDQITVEIKTPLKTLDSLSLHLSNLAYGYKQVYAETGGYGLSQSCNINVICPLGTGWEAERNSVALVLNDVGSEWCSGAMVMNTGNTTRPFFLTANHCYAPPGSSVQDVTDWRFTFQAWSTTCPSPGTNSAGVTYNGSTLRANWSGTDFCLVELNNTPPCNSNIHYAGWSRNTSGITSTTIIHHPVGDIMKISRDDGAPSTSTFSSASCWWLTLDQGATEGGSSGSPYFNQDHRIIGQHYGVNDASLPVCDRTNKFGGRFDLSWGGNGTNSTRLSNWLDPGNTNAATTNTTNIAALTVPSTITLSGSASLCSGSQVYTLSGVPSGATVSWSSSSAAVLITPGTNQATLTYQYDDFITLTATIYQTCASVPTYRTMTINVGSPVINFVTFYNALGDMGNWCYTHYGNSFVVEPRTNTQYYEARLLSYPSMSVVYTAPGTFTDSGVFGYPSSAGFYIFQLRATNACGTGNWWETEIEYVDCFNYGMRSAASSDITVQVSPNPARGNLYITLENEKTTAAASAENVSIELYDYFYNRTIRLWKMNGGQKQYRLSLAGIKKGHYIVVVKKGNLKQSKQVIIE